MKVAVRIPAAIENLGEFIADVRALEAAGADTVWVDPGSWEARAVLGAVAMVTNRIRIGSTSENAADETLQALSRGRMVRADAPHEPWIAIPVPADRDAWIAALRDCEARGASGVIVPWDPKLIDLLRNSEPDDRSDLLMSTG